MRELASVPAVLDAAHGNPRIRGGDPVDENAARIPFARHAPGAIYVLGPYVAAQPELACVGGFDRSVEIANPDQRRNRTEGFIIESGHSRSDATQHRWRIERAVSLHCFTTAQHACPFRHAALHLLMQRVTQVDPRHGSHLTRGVERVTDADRTS